MKLEWKNLTIGSAVKALVFWGGVGLIGLGLYSIHPGLFYLFAGLGIMAIVVVATFVQQEKAKLTERKRLKDQENEKRHEVNRKIWDGIKDRK
jgi:hypothetical protein